MLHWRQSTQSSRIHKENLPILIFVDRRIEEDVIVRMITFVHVEAPERVEDLLRESPGQHIARKRNLFVSKSSPVMSSHASRGVKATNFAFICHTR